MILMLQWNKHKKMLPVKKHQGLLVFEKKGKVRLFWSPADISIPSVFSVESDDGRSFKKHSTRITLFRADGTKTPLDSTLTARASIIGTKTILSLAAPDRKKGMIATVGSGGSWDILTETSLLRNPTIFIKIPSAQGKKSVVIAFSVRDSKTLFRASTTDTFERFRDNGDILDARRRSFDTGELIPLYGELTTHGILLVYTAKNASGKLTVGAALFDREHPETLLWRSAEALWEAPSGTFAHTKVIGGINHGKYFFIYLQSDGKPIEYFPIARYWETASKKQHPIFALPPRKKGIPIQLVRAQANPVLEPLHKNSWEAFATFNPAALYLAGRVHLLYRAQGYDGLSVLGYASSSDGISIDERLSYPVFISTRPFDSLPLSRQPFPALVSGGGTSGCEDPRLVEIDGSIYLIYIAFDGINPPGVALSYISTKNFLAKRFKWSQPTLISRPKQIQKNWVLFPEKIHGKYAVLHGLSPQVKIEYINDPKKLGHGKYIESLTSHGGGGYIEASRLHAWDNIVRGVGAPPLRTKYGWLVFYHGMDMRDPGRYKVGAMLLDLQHPERILCRAIEPVLEPETEYENNGHKRGVVYVCGAVIKGKKLFVYYGAADRTSAVAMADLETFLQDLIKNKAPTLEKMNVTKKL
jgi:beta-1,2-mannobiose phosphorylase / 1,2-beta-oligomannan phosphorylase